MTTLLERLRGTADYLADIPNYTAETDVREAVAALDAAPAWHDRPTGPGLWVVEDDKTVRCPGYLIYMLREDDMHPNGIPCGQQGRVFGPIPQDTEAT